LSSTSVLYLSPGDIGTSSPTGDVNGLSYLTGSTADFFFAFNAPSNESTSYLGNFSFSGDVTSTISPVGAPSDLTATLAGSPGQVVSTSFSVTPGTTYELTVTGTPGAAFDANITAGVSAAPEPAAWALMMVAIGGIGVAMRRSRRNALSAFAAA